MAKKNISTKDTPPSVKTPFKPNFENIGQTVASDVIEKSLLDNTIINNRLIPKGGKNKGLREGEERVSFVLLSGQYEKLQLIAYWERLSIKETVIEIFDKAIEAYERENGKIPPKPVRK